METELSTGKANFSPRAQARYYECTICKKGFSTAQALGGHMNIHRKDRAKIIRSVSDPSRLAVDVSDAVSLYEPASTSYEQAPMAGTAVRPWPRSNQVGKKTQLAGITAETQEELDLELRLGPEPTNKPKARPK